MNAGEPRVGSLEVQLHRLRAARDRATGRLVAYQTAELLELCAIDDTGLRAFAIEAEQSDAGSVARPRAFVAFGFIVALELLAETWAEREELAGGTDAG